MSINLQITRALEKSKSLVGFVAEGLNGLKIEELPQNRRLKLAMACQHLAIEHSQAIIALVDNKWYGSALALQRPLFDAVVRGVWLRYAATDDEIDKAAEGEFPTLEEMTSRSPKSMNQGDAAPLKVPKDLWWRRLCGYTHGGPEQLLARLDHTGIRANYSQEEILATLRWSDMAQLCAGVQMADAAGNGPLAQTFLDFHDREIDFEEAPG